MNPEETQSLFAARLELFDPILGKLVDADLMRLCEEITTISLPLPYDLDKRIHNLLGLAMDGEDYDQRYCAKSPMPTNPTVYDKTIPNNAANVALDKAKAVHMSKIATTLCRCQSWNRRLYPLSRG